MTTLSDFGEKRLLREIVWPLCGDSRALVGNGDDAVLLSLPEGHGILLSSDKIPEDLVAMQLGLMGPYEYGRYLATVNVSDIAAMGGTPLALLGTFAFPANTDIGFFKDFITGFTDAARDYGSPVVGGDLGWGSALCVSATVAGSIAPAQVLKRSGAQIGDLVFAAGYVGLFATALAYYLVAEPRGLKLPEEDELLLRTSLTRPEAMVSTGRALAAGGMCTACQDVTDGVGRTLFEIGEASSVHLEVHSDNLPIHRATRTVAKFLCLEPYEVVFDVGLDLALVGTLDAKFSSDFARQQSLTIIGHVRHGQGATAVNSRGQATDLSQKGWQHFAGSAIEVFRQSFSRNMT